MDPVSIALFVVVGAFLTGVSIAGAILAYEADATDQNRAQVESANPVERYGIEEIRGILDEASESYLEQVEEIVNNHKE